MGLEVVVDLGNSDGGCRSFGRVVQIEEMGYLGMVGRDGEGKYGDGIYGDDGQWPMDKRRQIGNFFGGWTRWVMVGS